eukprot:20906-Heterococcus_DN1.PRE.1
MSSRAASSSTQCIVGEGCPMPSKSSAEEALCSRLSALALRCRPSDGGSPLPLLPLPLPLLLLLLLLPPAAAAIVVCSVQYVPVRARGCRRISAATGV